MAMFPYVPAPMGFPGPTWVFPMQALPYPQSAAAPAPTQAGRRRARGGNSRLGVPPSEIRAAVESLYRDQLRPFGRLVRKRLAEHAAEMGIAARQVNDQRLRADCAACHSWLTIADAEGGEWIATLVGQPDNFVDPHCPDDLYPPQLWADLGAYLAELPEDDRLPGGRYLCARSLADRQLPFFSSYSLGQVAHVVQLAISHKKLLGYSEGALVPYSRSHSMLKEKKAESQQPCAAAEAGAVASWDSLRENLPRLFEETTSTGHHRIALSNVKYLFQSRFDEELSETALGYAKLSDLLQDPRLSGICEVKLQNAGHVLVSARHRAPISLCDMLPSQDVDAAPPLPLERRSRPRPLCLAEIASPTSMPSDAEGRNVSPACGAPLLSTTPLRTPYPPTPSPYSADAVANGMSLPRLLGSVRAAPPGVLDALKEEAPSCGASCGGAVCEADGVVKPKGRTPRTGRVPSHSQGRRWAPRPLTPATLDSLGFSVRNTFIDAALPPPTPMKVTSRSRASSAPRAVR